MERYSVFMMGSTKRKSLLILGRIKAISFESVENGHLGNVQHSTGYCGTQPGAWHVGCIKFNLTYTFNIRCCYWI